MPTLINSDLLAFAQRTAYDRVGAQAERECQDVVNAALMFNATQRMWPWYETTTMFSTNAPYQTGTITLTQDSTAVTIAGGVFPSWLTDGLIVVGQKVLEVATRTDDTNAVLVAAWPSATESLATNIVRQEYPLPTDLLVLHRILPGPTWGWGGSPVPYSNILDAQSAALYGQPYQTAYATYRDRLVLFPYPTRSDMQRMLYYRAPATLTLDDLTAVADWDPAHIAVLHRAIEYQVADRYQDAEQEARAMARYERAVDRAVGFDKRSDDLPGVLSHFAGVRGRIPMWRRRTVL